MAADTSSSAAAKIPVVGTAATAWASLSIDPRPAKSVAAEVIISGAAITYDIPTSNQYSDGPIATASGS